MLYLFPLQKPKRVKKPELSHYIEDIATDKFNNIYVINSLEFMVEIYSPHGKYINVIDYYKDKINNLNTKNPINKYSPKKITVDIYGNIYLYTPSITNDPIPSSGAVYSSEGKILRKGIVATLNGKGITNYDEKIMTNYNEYYYEFDSYAPDKKIPGKTIDKIKIKNEKGNVIAVCDQLQIANDDEGEIFKTDKLGNIYTFDYYQTLNVIKIQPDIKPQVRQ